jgi:D-alanyl-D-alanine carboxypeptidase
LFNHLLGAIEGVDGIKTGFTRASGFNLVTSVHRDGRYIVAVVMGGRSSLERDAQMRELISAQIKGIALKRAVPVIAKSKQPNDKPALAYVPVASQENPLDRIQPLSSSTFQTTPVQSASLAPTPQPQPNDQVAARSLPPAPPDDAAMTAPASQAKRSGLHCSQRTELSSSRTISSQRTHPRPPSVTGTLPQ